MKALLVPRVLATGSIVGAATAFRIGTASAAMLARRTPELLELAMRASAGGPGAGTAQASFRDELVALARDSAEVSWLQMRRGVDELDAATRPDEPPRARAHRPYRVKP